MSNLSEDIFKSERGIDYTSLGKLLKAELWTYADEETYKLMLKAAGREIKGYLDLSDIHNFPCTDLSTIDELWSKYSGGRFGLLVQTDIWKSLGGTENPDLEIWTNFRDEVGWPRNGDWPKTESNNIDDYNKGYFPLGKWAGSKIGDTSLSFGSTMDSRFIPALASKFARCNQ